MARAFLLRARAFSQGRDVDDVAAGVVTGRVPLEDLRVGVQGTDSNG